MNVLIINISHEEHRQLLLGHLDAVERSLRQIEQKLDLQSQLAASRQQLLEMKMENTCKDVLRHEHELEYCLKAIRSGCY